jgi:hypothetical protein
MNMSYGYLTDKTRLSDILAQLLEPSSPAPQATAQDVELPFEGSDLALTLSSLLGSEQTES